MAIVIAWISLLTMERGRVAFERKRVSGRERRTLRMPPLSLLLVPILAAAYVLAAPHHIETHHLLPEPHVRIASADALAEWFPGSRRDALPATEGFPRTSASACAAREPRSCVTPYGYASPVGY